MIYPDGEYYIDVVDGEVSEKELENARKAWCTSAKVKNGYLYIEGYLQAFVGDRYVRLPLAENVKYYSPGDPALGFPEEYYTQDDFNEGFGPIIFITIKNGVVTEISQVA